MIDKDAKDKERERERIKERDKQRSHDRAWARENDVKRKFKRDDPMRKWL